MSEPQARDLEQEVQIRALGAWLSLLGWACVAYAIYNVVPKPWLYKNGPGTRFFEMLKALWFFAGGGVLTGVGGKLGEFGQSARWLANTLSWFFVLAALISLRPLDAAGFCGAAGFAIQAHAILKVCRRALNGARADAVFNSDDPRLFDRPADYKGSAPYNFLLSRGAWSVALFCAAEVLRARA